MIPKSYKRRSITRETAALGRYKGMRPIVVSLDVIEGVLGFRLKGTRRTYSLTVDQAYTNAATLHGRRLIEERKARRKAKREAL